MNVNMSASMCVYIVYINVEELKEFAGSQHHRVGQVGKNQNGSTGPISLLKQGHPRTH